ncbi:MAG: LysR substrate-binding domain-containing protein [Pseudomonadota bacterium]
MKGITLKHLRYFDALARHKHFGRAADDCSISQPALSLQIKDLEAMFGAPLVERAARSIRLTPTGESFLQKSRQILLSVGELDDLARASKGLLAGRLRLGVIPTIAPYLLPRFMTAISEKFPGLDLTLREAVTGSLINDLSEGELDIALVALPMSEPKFTEYELFREEFVLVRHADDLAEPVPSPEMLQTMRLLLLEEGHCFRDQALSFCQFGDARPSELMEGSSLSTLVQMVGAGMGVTLIPDMAVPLEARAANVSVTRFPSPAPTRTIGMVWRASTPLANELEQIGALLRVLHVDRNET